METGMIQSRIEERFRKQVKADKKVKNAYLLVHSDRHGIHMNLAEGHTDGVEAHPDQPHYMASAGKLFTATVVAILHEQGVLSFDDPIARHLNNELMDGLHIYRGKDYSDAITIRHLLQQSSGLADVFWPLLKQIMQEPRRLSPREAILWGKEHLRPKARPGTKHVYTDTNYYLLGLIVEQVTGRPFHEALHRYIFDPLQMKHAYMQGYSEPAEPSAYPRARYYVNGLDPSTLEGFYQIDYAGGGVVATSEEYLAFIRALIGSRLVRKETLDRMRSDNLPMGFPQFNIRYGYSIWTFTSIPLLMPEAYSCWGCVGVTGSYLMHHPATGAFVVLGFNDVSYRSKAFRFMLSNVIKPLL
ncbi:serine hydrolase [Balneolales bacterium ANBcel1]|nr:serine hydrolase [Balneolales bacterium ANBcel1]